jgi:hypothetical protein
MTTVADGCQGRAVMIASTAIAAKPTSPVSAERRKGPNHVAEVSR